MIGGKLVVEHDLWEHYILDSARSTMRSRCTAIPLGYHLARTVCVASYNTVESCHVVFAIVNTGIGRLMMLAFQMVWALHQLIKHLNSSIGYCVGVHRLRCYHQ